MFETINSLSGLIGYLLETDPNQNSAGNMIPNDSGFTTLTTFQSSQLPGFTVKLLDFPAEATHLLYGLHVVLSHVVCDNIIRAPGRKHNPKKFHLVIARKTFEFDKRPLAKVFSPQRTQSK